jgi:hypothetical protein
MTFLGALMRVEPVVYCASPQTALAADLGPFRVTVTLLAARVSEGEPDDKDDSGLETASNLICLPGVKLSDILDNEGHPTH